MEFVVAFFQAILAWFAEDPIRVLYIVVGIGFYAGSIKLLIWLLGDSNDSNERIGNAVFYTYGLPAVVVIVSWYKIGEFLRAKRFEQTFGFTPRRPYPTIHAETSEARAAELREESFNLWAEKQRQVRWHLHRLAVEMQSAFDKERDAFVSQDHKAEKTAKVNVKKAKRNFWKAHSLAEENYFDVKKTFGEYLTI